MSKKDQKKTTEAEIENETSVQEAEMAAEAEVEVEESAEQEAAQEEWKAKYDQEHDSFLRLAAEYDNYRKRSLKEKDSSYTHGKADTLAKILPVYDNLERAMNQPTEDAAFKKGVEMTMQGLVKILNDLGVEIFGEAGETFDPNLHNAVMHTESEDLGENVIAQVFQKGFRTGDKVIRFAMVQVAN